MSFWLWIGRLVAVVLVGVALGILIVAGRVPSWGLMLIVLLGLTARQR